MNLASLLFSINGRVNRAPYWIVAIILCSIVLPFDISLYRNPDAGISGVHLLVAVAVLWPWIAIHAKRWNDIDKSGWWTIINLVPIIGLLFSLVVNGYLRGTQGRNRFGDDPLANSEPPM